MGPPLLARLPRPLSISGQLLRFFVGYRDKYVIQIYFKGGVADMPLHGPVEYLQAKLFLDTLVQKTHRPEDLPLPIPEPGQDMYDLTEKQLSAYADFLRRLRGRPPRRK
jgi:hypothetical protein